VLPSWDRMTLHVAVGTALAGNVRSSSWAAIAAHLMAARPLVDDPMLADVARRAAIEAARVGAFDEAADHLAVALDVTQAAGDTAERGALLWERGKMLWAAERAEESEQVLDEAAALARRTGDGELLARVALSWRGGELRAIFRHRDHRFLALLREALTLNGSGDSHRRCLLLSTWTRCAFWDIADAEALAACDEGLAMARRLGDPEVLTNALGTRFYYRWRPELARERLAIADEMLSVAVAAADPRLIVEGRYFRLLALLDLGWLRDAWSELDRFDEAVAASGQPLMKLRALWLRAARHLAMGDRLLADEVAGQASGLAERMGRPDAAVELMGQRLVVLASEGRPDDAVRLVSPGLLGPVAYNAVVALANGLGGQPAEARASLSAVVTAGLDRFPRDMSWLFTRCGLLAAAAVSGDADTAQILYDALEPFAGQWAVLNPGVMVLGVVDHYLGLGAAVLGRLDEALDHLRRAAAIHGSEGAVALALLSLHELTTALDRRNDPGDAAEVARAGQRMAELAGRNTVPFTPLLAVAWSAGAAGVVPEHRQCLVLEGDIWLVEFAGGQVRLRDQRGLHHLRTLLERPGVEIPALTLAGGDGGLAGSIEGTILDERALCEYRQRITDLQEDIDDATSDNDIERGARAKAELDALVGQLAAVTGVGGRPRRFAGADERARVSVTKAIRTAISHLDEQLPDLGRHLAATVHTGTRCLYQPDPRVRQRWTTERV